MKKTILITLLLALLISVPAAAQKKDGKNHAEWHKEFVDFKVNYMVQEAGIRDDQKKKFVDLYTQMEGEKGKIYRVSRNAEKAVKDNPKATDAQYEAAANAMTDTKVEDARIEKAYYSKFRAFLSPKQMYLLKKAERHFTHKLMQMHGGKKDKGKGKK